MGAQRPWLSSRRQPVPPAYCSPVRHISVSARKRRHKLAEVRRRRHIVFRAQQLGMVIGYAPAFSSMNTASPHARSRSARERYDKTPHSCTWPLRCRPAKPATSRTPHSPAGGQLKRPAARSAATAAAPQLRLMFCESPSADGGAWRPPRSAMGRWTGRRAHRQSHRAGAAHRSRRSGAGGARSPPAAVASGVDGAGERTEDHAARGGLGQRPPLPTPGGAQPQQDQAEQRRGPAR